MTTLVPDPQPEPRPGATDAGAFRLSGGPDRLVDLPPVPQRRDASRLTFRWTGGYEHYELDRHTDGDTTMPLYRWTYRTEVAE
ncbi:DUF5988 family protein [Actinosynnema sp. NPDC047251]|uniref:DUF5988 family protein n=1 Tax=Saccharothrix espanaensis TaxID=103731 RepID=UPI00059D6BD8